MANTIHTVVKGDTLWDLAKKYGTTVSKLVELNDISNPDYIVVGQKLIISGEGATTKANTTSKPAIKVFGLQSNTDRTVYATWTWDKENTKEYQVMWYYDTGDDVWFVGSDTKVTEKQAIYNAPSNAIRVKFKVKAISETHTVNDKETSYWTGAWSTESTYSFKDNPPSKPSVPSVTIDEYTLTARLDNLDLNATAIEFQIVKDDSLIFNSGTGLINNTNTVIYSCKVTAGGRYKVRCRSIRSKLKSDWSEYSGNVETIPAVPSGITVCRASSETSVYLEWNAVGNAKSYDIEYTTKKNYFDGSDQTSSVNGIEYTRYEKTGLTSGEEYFFRVRAVNDKGHSGWSGIISTIIGKDPAAPTTWSSTTTAITGEPLTLYWVHNSEDGSSQTYAELELIIDGIEETHTIKNSEDEDEKDKTSSYKINTSRYREGTVIKWRVRTAGITKTYGDWSVQRTIDIYAPPTIALNIIDSNSNNIYELTSFPFYVSGLAGPNTQVPIGYHVVVTSNEVYETVDSIGNPKFINKGEQIYSRYFDISEELMVEFSANNIDLENNVTYTVTCTVSMDSGLTATASREFSVAWTDEQYEPTAEIGVDIDTYSAYIRPYCENENRGRIENISLSVYRREFDGKFTKLATGLNNDEDVFITDPHPSLDYARYRIVATNKSTGAVSYYDVPGYPVGGNAVIIQWDEEWRSFDVQSDDALEQPAWSGSMLKLPYNVDVSDSYKPDVNLVNYIGRERPVGYYGTHLGETSTWSVEIPASDKETLYGLRRLATWMGNVYVREPSGSGYWANITVSFSQKHCEVTIPVTFNITRVEGGI